MAGGCFNQLNSQVDATFAHLRYKRKVALNLDGVFFLYFFSTLLSLEPNRGTFSQLDITAAEEKEKGHSTSEHTVDQTYKLNFLMPL